MPPRRCQNLSKSRKKDVIKRKELAAHAMEDCVFSQDIMTCILIFLPVRSLLRFMSVCKPWRELFASPKFIKQHHDQFSDDPRNRSLMIYSLSMDYEHTMSLLDMEKGITKLDHPYPVNFCKMDFIGCCIGLVCMTTPPFGQPIVLWNPAMKLWKLLRLSDLMLFGVPDKVSVGFGYDAQENDFMVVRIVCLREKKKKFEVGAEVYSANSGSWETIEVSCNFHVLATKNDAIVNGNPYWVAKVVENENGMRHDGAIVCFDVKKKVFDFLPVPVPVPVLSLTLEVGSKAQLVDWNGSLGFLLCNENNERVKSIDVYVFDGGERSWSKKHTFGPIEMGVNKLLHYSKSSKILGEFPGGKLFLYDTESKDVHETLIDGAQPQSFVAFEYSDSLASINGMEQVVVKREQEEEEELELEEEEEEEEEEDEEELTVTGGSRSVVNAEVLSSYLECFGIPTRPRRFIE